MDPVLGIALGTTVAFVSALVLLDLEHARRAALRVLARELRLDNAREERRLGWTQSVQGERDGLLIRVTRIDHRNAPSDVRIVLDGRGRFPRTIDLRLESIATGLAKHFGRKELEIGDEAFDNSAFIRGPELALQAALDPRTRWLICDLLQAGGRIADGVLHHTLRATSVADTTKVCGAVEAMIGLADRLKDAEDLLARLCERYREETSLGVRLRLLELLADRFPAEREARAVFRDALLATDDRLRLHAARVLGEEGRDALIEIAAHTDGDNSQAVRAIELLGRRLPIESALDALNGALRAGHRHIAAAAIHTLGLHGGPAAIARLAVVLAVADSELAVAAAHALAATEDPSVEALLLDALATVQPDVAVAACSALGSVGSITAVPTLREIALATATDRAVAQAARHAVASIQSRLAGASPGQVSLADGEAGQLTFAQAPETGRLSITGKAHGA